jgi:hypothetical protein
MKTKEFKDEGITLNIGSIKAFHWDNKILKISARNYFHKDSVICIGDPKKNICTYLNKNFSGWLFYDGNLGIPKQPSYKTVLFKNREIIFDVKDLVDPDSWSLGTYPDPDKEIYDFIKASGAKEFCEQKTLIHMERICNGISAVITEGDNTVLLHPSDKYIIPDKSGKIKGSVNQYLASLNSTEIGERESAVNIEKVWLNYSEKQKDQCWLRTKDRLRGKLQKRLSSVPTEEREKIIDLVCTHFWIEYINQSPEGECSEVEVDEYLEQEILLSLN